MMDYIFKTYRYTQYLPPGQRFKPRTIKQRVLIYLRSSAPHSPSSLLNYLIDCSLDNIFLTHDQLLGVLENTFKVNNFDFRHQGYSNQTIKTLVASRVNAYICRDYDYGYRVDLLFKILNELANIIEINP